jgi:choline monooxygenase
MDQPRLRPLLESLAPSWYVDPALYQRERTEIFARTWQLLGPIDPVSAPGGYLATTIAGWNLVVLRDRDGVLRGFHNVCRHRGAPLLETGEGHCDVLRCRYHGWVYDGQGRLRKAPHFGDDPGFRIEDYPLTPIRVATWRGLLWASIAAVGPGLEESLASLADEVADQPLERYRFVRSVRFEMASNWKTYTDNFVEGYHVPGIHPSFDAAIDFSRFETVALDGVVRMTAPQKSGSIYNGKWLWGWPNWTLSTFTGGMNTSRIVPLGVDRTALVYHFYFAADVDPVERDRVIETNCSIVREDFGICEQTQLNLASGAYAPGPLSPRHERGVHYFHQRLRATLACD